jgi:hypothetical protein
MAIDVSPVESSSSLKAVSGMTLAGVSSCYITATRNWSRLIDVNYVANGGKLSRDSARFQSLLEAVC